MVTHQHLILFIFHIVYTILCTSVCRYEQPYIVWNNTNYPYESGVYARDYLDLVTSGTPVHCGAHSSTFNGTWIYTLNRGNGSASLYLYQDSNNGNRLMISEKPCSSSYARFRTDPTDTSAILDGTNCDWTLIDDPAIPWKYASNDNPLNGTTILCDGTTGCDSPNPTNAPTKSPIPTTAAPSRDPTTPFPSISPSVSTDAPSKSPTKSPTVKPTNLPTVVKPLYDQPPCVAMMVTNLHKAFPMQAEYHEKFNEVKNYAYNQRRVWSNGGSTSPNQIEIFYTNRYEPGRWVISNGAYHLMNDRDQLVDGGINQSFPGDDSGHGLYDHYPNDNPMGIANGSWTIRFVCQNTSIHGTRYPTPLPSPAPSLAPTLTPSLSPSVSPSTAPIAICGKMIFQNMKNTDNTTNNACANITGSGGMGIIVDNIEFARYGYHNNHTAWKRQDLPPKDWDLYYSNLLQSWVLNFKHKDKNISDFQGLVNPQEEGLETPPKLSEWYYVEHTDLFTPVCTLIVHIRCFDELSPTRAYLAHTQGPTPAPSASPSMAPVQPPTVAPTTPPSDAPSYSPSTAPTSPPTLLCGGLTVGIDSDKFGDRYDWFRGNYRRQDPDDLIADHFWWQSREVAGSRIFYSDVTFHNTWVIQSREASSYWLLPEYNHDLYYLQPPLSTLWEFYTGDSVFARDVAQISFNCTLSLLPTTDPTLSPSMTPTQPPSQSPTATPSLSPSQTPSLSPSLTPTNHPTTPAPTNAPTFTPSIAPTNAPTREACDYLQVRADNILLIEFNGLYDIMINGSNGFPSWNIINDYGTYIIEKQLTANYWIINKINITSNNITERHSLNIQDLVSMENNYNWRPPIYGKWQFWKTQPNPTRAPTETPTTAPTSITNTPTIPPSNAPSIIPTNDPTIEPTINPTKSPSMEPTTDPTIEPTQGTSQPTNMPTINPTLEPTFDPTFEPTNRPTISPSYEPTIEPTKTPINTRRRRNLLQQDPPQGTRVYGTEYSIYMDCVNSDAPTYDPTTAQPTKAPTSKCEALRIAKPINNALIWNYFWFGEYVRMDYLINNKPWFIATHGNSSLEFIDGQWTIMRRDRDLGPDEDPILIFRNETYPNPLTWLLQSQYGKPWYNIKYKTEIIIDIICMGSIPPTPAPSFSPSISPTIETEPIWINCVNNWFTFVTPNQYAEMNTELNETYGIYWDIPIAKGEDIGDVEVDIIYELSSPEIFLDPLDINSDIMIQGDNLLDFGVYTIVYRAYNIYNENDTEVLTNDCEIKLYVIGNTYLDTSGYCYNQKFIVDIAFNETFYEIKDFDFGDSDSTESNDESTEYEQDAIINIIGYATNSELRELNENCYIYGKQLINHTEIIPIDADSSSYLGIEANAIIWDLLIIIILLCLFGLCCWRLYFCRKKYKENKENEAAQQLLPNKSERVMSGDSMDINDDDLVIENIAPETQRVKSPGDSGSPLLSQSKRKHQPGSLSDDENGKTQWQKSQSIDEQQEELGGTKGQNNDNAINALIGDAFDNETNNDNNEESEEFEFRVGDGGHVTGGGPNENEGGAGGAVEMQPIQKIDSLDQGGDLPNENENKNEQQSEDEPQPQPVIPPSMPPPVPQPPQPPQPQPQSMPQPVWNDDDDDDEDSEFDDDSEFEFRV